MDSDLYMATLSLLNNTKINISNQKNRLRKSRVIFHPKIMKNHTKPDMSTSILFNFILGILSCVLLVSYLESLKQDLTIARNNLDDG